MNNNHDGAMRDAAASFSAVVHKRRAVRDFLPTALSQKEIDSVLEDARWSPSNANIQPWQVHIVSGATRERLATSLLRNFDANEQSSDYWFDYMDFSGVYSDRIQHMGSTFYGTLNIARDDHEARHTQIKRNLSFYGAPHVALLFMPQFGDGVRLAADIGMYAQTFLLSLVARGYAGIPQTMLGMYAGTIRRELGISDEMKMLFGISFGLAKSPEVDEATNPGRANITDTVVFHM